MIYNQLTGLENVPDCSPPEVWYVQKHNKDMFDKYDTEVCSNGFGEFGS